LTWGDCLSRPSKEKIGPQLSITHTKKEKIENGVELRKIWHALSGGKKKTKDRRSFAALEEKTQGPEMRTYLFNAGDYENQRRSQWETKDSMVGDPEDRHGRRGKIFN